MIALFDPMKLLVSLDEAYCDHEKLVRVQAKRSQQELRENDECWGVPWQHTPYAVEVGAGVAKHCCINSLHISCQYPNSNTPTPTPPTTKHNKAL